MSESRLTSEEFWKDQNEIPGSTRVPIDEIKEFAPKSENKMVILDVGSGEGRSTADLMENFPDAEVIAFDLCGEGLLSTLATDERVQGTALELPFKSETVDCVVVCGVMTNIVDQDPDKAVQARKKVIKEFARVLTPGGVCVISDFSNEHNKSNYPVNYSRHQLITGEYGTIAVFDRKAEVTFRNKTDEEVAALAKSLYLERFAHHYSPDELRELVENNGTLDVIKTSLEVGKTPSGKAIDTIVMTVKKQTSSEEN